MRLQSRIPVGIRSAGGISCLLLLLVGSVTPGCLSPLVWNPQVQAFGLYRIRAQSRDSHYYGVAFQGLGFCRTPRGVSLGYQSVRLVCADTCAEGTTVELDGLELVTGAKAEARATAAATTGGLP